MGVNGLYEGSRVRREGEETGRGRGTSILHLVWWCCGLWAVILTLPTSLPPPPSLPLFLSLPPAPRSPCHPPRHLPCHPAPWCLALLPVVYGVSV
jgi:hypothetical protein